jgi:predicted O-linked N-acetylglucosamine transferase (SPINDLY family)
LFFVLPQVLVTGDGWAKGGNMKLFALKPAPIAVSLMGTITTLGSPFIDYMVTDERATPRNTSDWYSEKLLSLPSFFLTSYRENFPGIPTSPRRSTRKAALGSGVLDEEEGILFACLGRLGKITEPYFDTFMNILHRVPNSTLWLLEYPTASVETVYRHAEARGISRTRIVFSFIVPIGKWKHLTCISFLLVSFPTVLSCLVLSRILLSCLLSPHLFSSPLL